MGIPCTLCSIQLPDILSLQKHAKTPQHRLCHLQEYYTVNRSTLIKEKKGILISANLKEDCPKNVREEDGRISLYIKNGCAGTVNVYIKNSNSTSVLLRQVEALYPCSYIELSDKHGVTAGDKILKLNKGACYKVCFGAMQGGEGVQEMPVVFQFTIGDSDEYVFILRILTVQFLDEISESCLPSSLFQRIKTQKGMYQPPRPGFFMPGRKRPGYLLDGTNNYSFSYYYPRVLRDIVQCQFDPKRVTGEAQEAELRGIKQLMAEGLQPHNYEKWFKTMMWLDEIQQEHELKHYHQLGVPLILLREAGSKPGESLLQLHVPGLSEKRPSVMCGDSIFIRHAGQETPVYEGIVHSICNENVKLGLDDSFMQGFHKGMLVDAQFWFNRTTLIRCHKSIPNCERLMHILFPSLPTEPCPVPEAPLKFFDPRIAANLEQSQAVAAMVYGYSSPAPYILFGPPGTGKTLTVVEAIKQIYKMDRKCHVLVCGPSNSSCDILTERLLPDVADTHIIRVNAKSRHVGSISAAVKRVSPIEGEDEIRIPSKAELSTYNIIVTTFMSAIHVAPEPDEDGIYTHIFLDECGHGQEPEALIPLLGLGDVVILAGDPRQLGPMVKSRYCYTGGKYFSNNGLDQSLLERLMKRALYLPDEHTGKYNPRVVTKLLDNYRSHSAILEVPNRLFYNSELRSSGPEKLLTSMLSWRRLPNKNMPLIFHGVNGKDAREGNSPSYFNPQEVSEVISYVDKLRKEMKVKAEDIGIVAPYRTQIKKIRLALNIHMQDWAKDLRVGSPEEFQGDERLVIIISTVRATAELLLNDTFLQLGFLQNPKRFNVAATRAKALLVVVGCPWLLYRDPHWGALLKYCKTHGCYKGCSYDGLPHSDVEKIYKTLEQLQIDTTEAEDVDTA